jgi:hypothetical protein
MTPSVVVVVIVTGVSAVAAVAVDTDQHICHLTYSIV